MGAGEAIDPHHARLGKLNRGKCCIRFKRLADLPLEAVTDILKDVVALHQGG